MRAPPIPIMCAGHGAQRRVPALSTGEVDRLSPRSRRLTTDILLQGVIAPIPPFAEDVNPSLDCEPAGVTTTLVRSSPPLSLYPDWTNAQFHPRLNRCFSSGGAPQLRQGDQSKCNRGFRSSRCSSRPRFCS